MLTAVDFEDIIERVGNRLEPASVVADDYGITTNYVTLIVAGKVTPKLRSRYESNRAYEEIRERQRLLNWPVSDELRKFQETKRRRDRHAQQG